MLITPATPKDIKKVFDWRNSPEILSKGNGIKVDWNTHHKWFDKVLADDDKFLLIIEEAGAVRLERQGKQCEISVYVTPHRQGEGLGKKAIQEATRLAFATWEINSVLAIVNMWNFLSRKVFTKCGYLYPVGEHFYQYNGGMYVRMYNFDK